MQAHEKQMVCTPERAPTANNGGGKSRTLKATISADEFHMVVWGARHSPHRLRGKLPLADFLRLALVEQLRTVVRGEIAAGREVPSNIAHYLSERRGG